MNKSQKTYHRNQLIAKWHRSEPLNDGNIMTEYAQLHIDGSYEFSFIEHNDNGDIISQVVEMGDWGLIGDIHFTISKSEFFEGHHYAADMENDENYHAYRVLTLNSQIFEYQHVLTNEVFILTRVVDSIGHC